jgi:radical SAM protein with 4Fe4S-binding SPASM domain
MLQVSELLRLARDEAAALASPAELRARSPERFERLGLRAPVIVWNVCRHCNMSCPHCYAAAAYRPSSEDLSTAEARRLLDELAAAGVRIVIFSGGEPLLRSDLFELLRHASDLGISPQLSTNGVYIDDETASRIAAAGVAYVGVSIDGLRDFNDDYRGMSGGFEAASRGLRASKAAGLRTGLRMTLTRRNVAQLEAMARVALELEVDRFYVSHLLYSGRGRRMAQEDLSRDEARAALFALFALAEAMLDREATTRVVTGSNDSDGPLLLRWIEARYGTRAAGPVERLLADRGGNSAGERILNIDHRGHVHPDQFWRSETLGDVRREPFDAILAHPTRRLLAERVEHLTGRCAACRYQALCRGSHRERALAFHGDRWASDPACVLEDAEIGLTAATGDAQPETAREAG